ncbi:MAG: Spy/CpxP family protein refolding chaperone [Kiritimatiellae bacterium]|nr:Spy/CpxP family protein refolding chaperone [Kiritimatiellia bacterium]
MKLATMLVSAIAACACFAQGPAPREGGGRGFMRNGGGMMGDPIVRLAMNPRVAEKLGLTDEQKEKMKALRDGRKGGMEKFGEIRKLEEKQVALMKAENVDEAAVMAAIDELFELRKAMAKDQAKLAIAIRAILTPEQIAKGQEELKNFGPDRRPRRNGQGDK